MSNMGIGGIRALGNWGMGPLVTLILLMPLFLFSEIHPMFQQGLEQYKRGEFDSALGSFNQIIEEYPEHKEGYYNRALCLYQSKKYDEAITGFEQCLKIDSCYTQARWMKAQALQQMGKGKSALTELKNAIILCEDNNVGVTDINHTGKRIRLYIFAVYISKNWYYMIALTFLFIVLMGVSIKMMAPKKG